MTKSQNKKNEQQKDLCITSEQLTEQWKKGELPEGEYWLKTVATRLPEKGFFTSINGKFDFYRKPEGFRQQNALAVEQVLAPVPSYEQWKDARNWELYADSRMKRLEKQLAIAVEALNWYDGLEKMLIGWEIVTGQERGTAEKALCEIEGLEK